ncbi:hypothetical protein J6590_043811 [Homalodisca vitripennis]|nr:hypothetical protein J6590_043811 [Homalodisca vitripennis]
MSRSMRATKDRSLELTEAENSQSLRAPGDSLQLTEAEKCLRDSLNDSAMCSQDHVEINPPNMRRRKHGVSKTVGDISACLAFSQHQDRPWSRAPWRMDNDSIVNTVDTDLSRLLTCKSILQLQLEL